MTGQAPVGIAFLRREVGRLTDSDWLLLSLAAAVVGVIGVDAYGWGQSQALYGQSSAHLSVFISLALLIGFLDGWRRQHRPLPASLALFRNPWSDWLEPIWLAVIVVALPAAAFYGAQGANSTLAAAIAILLVGAAALVGSLLARWRGFGGATVAGGLTWLILARPTTLAPLEQALTGGTNDLILAGLFALGLLGTLIAGAELAKNALADRQYFRSLTLFSFNGGFPSFTGTGAFLITGWLMIVRDKFFWAMAGLTVIGELLGLSQLGRSVDGRVVFLVVLAATLVLSTGVLSLTDRYQERLSTTRSHWPMEKGIVGLTTFIAGLTLVLALAGLVNFSLLGFSADSSLFLLGLTGAAYSVAAMISSQSLAKSRGQYGRVWLIIYRSLVFAATFALLGLVSDTGLFLSALSLLVLTLFSFGYRSRPHWATI